MRALKYLFYLSLLILVIYNIFLSSSSVRNGEVNFYNDVARDFLLLEELDDKKIVFIGPRSSTNGLFHGPLWTYINYPAYIIGGGDPIIVAWFWIFLEMIFLVASFFMVKKLLGLFPAFVYILITSVRMVLQANGIFHSEAVFFFIPLFFFSISMYLQTKKFLYLALHFIVVAMIVQLNVGVGIQFLMLSSLLSVFLIHRNKLWKHLLSFSLLPLFLINFILFDFKNEFRMVKAVSSTGESFKFFITLNSWIANRIDNIISLQLFENTTENKIIILITFTLVLASSISLIKGKNKYKHLYVLFIFYFFGYMVTSFFNKGLLLAHYVIILIPLTSLWFVSFLSTKLKYIFIPLIAIVFFLNFNSVRGEIIAEGSFEGNHYNSWKGLSTVAKEIIRQEQGKEFGYYVFAPDAFAYQPRYAMKYNFKAAKAKAYEYVKKPTTYVIGAPPPPDNPYMTHVFWRKNQAKISQEPVETKKFPSGFTLEKFNLSKEEQNIPHDKNIELGIHFR